MEHMPLRQEAEPGSPLFRGKSAISNQLVSKRTFLMAVIVMLILVVLVIILGALYGVERSKRKGKNLIMSVHAILKLYAT